MSGIDAGPLLHPAATGLSPDTMTALLNEIGDAIRAARDHGETVSLTADGQPIAVIAPFWETAVPQLPEGYLRETGSRPDLFQVLSPDMHQASNVQIELINVTKIARVIAALLRRGRISALDLRLEDDATDADAIEGWLRR